MKETHKKLNQLWIKSPSLQIDSFEGNNPHLNVLVGKYFLKTKMNCITLES